MNYCKNCGHDCSYMDARTPEERVKDAKLAVDSVTENSGGENVIVYINATGCTDPKSEGTRQMETIEHPTKQ